LLNDCQVPAANRSAKKARPKIALTVDGGRIGIAARPSAAQGALDGSIKYKHAALAKASRLSSDP
jgi:hypothetical protein